MMWSRWLGVLGLAARRMAHGSRGVWISIVGVALSIALMVIVGSVGFGLASQSMIRGQGVDYWVMAQEDGQTTSVLSVEGPALGRVHMATEEILGHETVSGATPVYVQLLRVNSSGTVEHVIAIGVIPHNGIEEVAGIPLPGLRPGDPYYANGSFNGMWTGEAILSDSAAALLQVTPGDRVSVKDHPIRVIGVAEPDMQFGAFPVMVMHLSELQVLVGAQQNDQAQQILVSGEELESFLESVYPGAVVTSEGGLNPSSINPGLPLAMAVTASLVALVLGSLFLATTMGLEVASDRQHLAILDALGFPRRTRSLLVVAQALCITLLGGLFGVSLGVIGVWGVNWLMSMYFSLEGLAVLHPVMGVLGLGVAVLIGLLAAPYLLVLTRGTSVVEELSR